ncbi:MAG: MBL fold metallo-hydrolase [Oscillospiraceae bacterium]|nr:MBL fold metallo-hydrolase [Oscillospiraceae bacterium]
MSRKWIQLLVVLAALAALLLGCGDNSEEAERRKYASADASLHLWCFQAGKADAFLLWNDAGAILIDTGESGYGKTILTKLSELGIRRLNALILTHFDKDHVGGAKKILNEIPVERVLQSNCPKPGAEAYENYLQALTSQRMEPTTVREPMELSLGSATLRIDPPAEECYPEDESNNSSLVVTVCCGEQRMLFCGDAEALRLQELLARQPGHCELLKLPHHGRYQELLEELLTQTQPRYAVITSSEAEPEDAETMELLAEHGVEALLTRNGAFEIVGDGKSLQVFGVE